MQPLRRGGYRYTIHSHTVREKREQSMSELSLSGRRAGLAIRR